MKNGEFSLVNRKQRREFDKKSLSEGRRKQKLGWDEFKNVTKTAIEKHLALNPTSDFRPDFVWQNNKYIVQVFLGIQRKNRTYDKAMIRRPDARPIDSWSDLQRVKNEIFGPEIEAIQFFPPQSELIDDANLYWLFIEQK